MGNTFQRAAPVNLEANREDEEGPSEGIQPVRAQKRYVLFQCFNINGILFQKWFWSPLSKKISSDRKKLLQIRGLEFANLLRSLKSVIHDKISVLHIFYWSNFPLLFQLSLACKSAENLIKNCSRKSYAKHCSYHEGQFIRTVKGLF